MITNWPVRWCTLLPRAISAWLPSVMLPWYRQGRRVVTEETAMCRASMKDILVILVPCSTCRKLVRMKSYSSPVAARVYVPCFTWIGMLLLRLWVILITVFSWPLTIATSSYVNVQRANCRREVCMKPWKTSINTIVPKPASSVLIVTVCSATFTVLHPSWTKRWK